VLADQPDVFDQAAAHAAHAQWERAMTVLSRAAGTHPHLAGRIYHLITTHPRTAAAAAVAVAIETQQPQPLRRSSRSSSSASR
jgi:hypothetical protein